MTGNHLRCTTRALLVAIILAIAFAVYMQEVAYAGVSDRELAALRAQVNVQARRIASLERVTAEQRAELGWFRECTAPLGVGSLLGPPPTYVLAVRPHCVPGAPSGFPW